MLIGKEVFAKQLTGFHQRTGSQDRLPRCVHEAKIETVLAVFVTQSHGALRIRIITKDRLPCGQAFETASSVLRRWRMQQPLQEAPSTEPQPLELSSEVTAKKKKGHR